MNKTVLEKLIKLADSLDQQGSLDIAEKVDNVIKVFVGGKEPFSNLSVEDKKSIISFMFQAEENVASAMHHLEKLSETFSSLQLSDSFGLGEFIDSLKELSESISDVKTTLYENMHGESLSKEKAKALVTELEQENNAEISDDDKKSLAAFWAK